MRRYFHIFLVVLGISAAFLVVQQYKLWPKLHWKKFMLLPQPNNQIIDKPSGKENTTTEQILPAAVTTNTTTREKNQSTAATFDREEICSEFIRFSDVINASVDTSLANWSFNTSVKCPQFPIDNYTVPRLKVVLECDGNNGRLVKSSTNSSQDISVTEFGNMCLLNVIQKCCTGKQPVPNVIHYVWFYTSDMNYFHFLSMMSTIRFIKPCLILIHGPSLPTGKYWDYIVSVMPNIIHVKRQRPTTIFGHVLAHATHSSDLMRIEALKRYGGIYLDFDEVILRPLEPLRKYRYTQGREEPEALGSQLVMAEKGALFLHLWYHGYRKYQSQWGYNALVYPDKLARQNPNLIHVEGFNFTRPAWDQAVELIHKGSYDWSTNYAMHMLHRANRDEINLTTIRRLKTTVGSVSRHVLFGNKELCEE